MTQSIELPLEMRLRAADQSMAPKYYIVKRAIIRKIEKEEYKENELIPSERELTEMFGVSRITVRRAVYELVGENYLYRIQGKGTYVKSDKIQQNLISITSCTQDVINLGMTPRRHVISASTEIADQRRRRLLELGDNERVFRLERIYFADDDPLNHTVTYLPYKLFPGIDAHDFSCESLYSVLGSQYGCQITTATRTIEAVLAEGKIARYLEVSSGTPILHFECVTRGKIHGRECPIEFFKCCYRSDKFKFYINQVMDGGDGDRRSL